MARRDELIDAAAWAVAGAAILVASWRMDRLDSRGINPWSAPGLTPGLVGALMIALALLLALSARRSSAPDRPADPDRRGAWQRTLTALALCLVFGGVTLGSGLPFVVQGTVFVFAFATVFGWSRWKAAGRLGRGLLQAGTIAVIATALIAWLFESVFLVRLP